MELVIEPVTAERWPDMIALFERPGPRGGTPIPGSCWCMPWRGNQPSRVVRKAAMSEIVAADRRPGLLAYADGVPVGWVAMAAKDDYEGVARSKLLGSGPDDHEVFAITCFYVDPAFRGDGVSSALLDGAIAEARSRGAAACAARPDLG